MLRGQCQDLGVITTLLFTIWGAWPSQITCFLNVNSVHKNYTLLEGHRLTLFGKECNFICATQTVNQNSRLTLNSTNFTVIILMLKFSPAFRIIELMG